MLGALPRARARGGRPGRRRDRRRLRPGPLAGAPLAVKDCFDVAGEPTSCGIRGRGSMPRASADAAVLAPLASLPLVGKTAMHQLAWGMSGEARGYAANRNPVDPGRMPGGSSGGSATAVAAGIVPLALGTDSGGSVRQPAAWCGVVGLKPTLGTLPTAGCAPMARSLDTVGVLARSVRDAAAALVLLTGAAPAAAAAPRRIGVVEELFEGCDDGVAASCRAALARLEADGTGSCRSPFPGSAARSGRSTLTSWPRTGATASRPSRTRSSPRCARGSRPGAR
ncbi:MAG: amidase [Thermoleophilia bacterium]